MGRPRSPKKVGETTDPGGWTFTIAGDLPAGWIPLVPVPKGTGAEIQLQRGRLAGWTAEEEPRALLLNIPADPTVPATPLKMDEEVVPRGGMRVSRHYQRARGADGKVYLWIGRQKQPGRGEQSSGLVMDRLKVSG